MFHSNAVEMRTTWRQNMAIFLCTGQFSLTHNTIVAHSLRFHVCVSLVLVYSVVYPIEPLCLLDILMESICATRLETFILYLFATTKNETLAYKVRHQFIPVFLQ